LLDGAVSASPSRSRLRRAWQAGVRTQSAWLPTGVACCGLALLLTSAAGPGATISAKITAALGDPGRDTAVLEVIDAALSAGIVVLGSIAIIVALAVVLTGAVLDRLGAVRSESGQGLGMKNVPMRLRVAIGGAAMICGVAAFDLQRRIAGGARAADTSEAGLTALWQGSATATLSAIGVAMIVVGAAEAWQIRRDQIGALAPTPEQVADEARDAGRRRA
jgi:hypothetical protein